MDISQVYDELKDCFIFMLYGVPSCFAFFMIDYRVAAIATIIIFAIPLIIMVFLISFVIILAGFGYIEECLFGKKQ